MREPMVYEVGPFAAGGFGWTAQTQKIGLQLANLLGFSGFEEFLEPRERWIDFIGEGIAPVVIDPTAHLTGTPCMSPDFVSQLAVQLPERFQDRRYWLNTTEADLGMPTSLHESVLQAVIQAANPIACSRLGAKNLLSRLAQLGIANIPLTIPASAATPDRKWVYKPYDEYGGFGITLEKPANPAGWLAQERIENRELFPIPVSGEWRLESRPTDLRLFWSAIADRVVSLGGFFARIGSGDSIVCNISSGGTLAAVYLVDDPAAAILEWNERMIKLKPEEVVPKVEKWSHEAGLLYNHKPIPVSFRPRFLPKTILAWAEDWARGAQSALWQLNKEVPHDDDWDDLCPWTADRRLWFSVDLGVSFQD